MTPSKNTSNKLADDVKPAEGAENAPKVDPQPTETGIEKSELKSVKEVAGEVLAGRWGANYAIAAQKLEEAGYDTDAVWAEYTRRKAAGAPYAF